MDRFEYSESVLLPNETSLAKEKNVKLYDGDQKTSFERGELILSTHRILWARPGDNQKGLACLSLPLRYIVFIEDEVPSSFSFSRSHKIVLHLSKPIAGHNPGPVQNSSNNHIKLSFKDGLTTDLTNKLNNAIQEKKWEQIISASRPNLPVIKTRTGIVGIERSLQEKQKATDESISIAFQDLSKLMVKAREMVNLSNVISNKIREKQGDITEDETIRFKSYLMSLGIDDPVTREGYKTEDQYYKNLARELSDILLEPITEVGGMMLLTDVYCRVNRARGMELISPEDLLNACQLLESLNQPIRMHKFDSGVIVLQLSTYNNVNIVNATAEALISKTLTAEELAQSLGIPVMLAKERLLLTEKYGQACRDDSIEGLRFYPNRFLTEE